MELIEAFISRTEWEFANEKVFMDESGQVIDT